MTSTPAGRSQSSRVKSFRSLEPSSSELLNYSGWCGFLTWVSTVSSEEGYSQMTSVNFSLGAANPQLGLGAAIYSRGATPREKTQMPMHAITLMPSDMTVARQVLASYHATCGTVKEFSL